MHAETLTFVLRGGFVARLLRLWVCLEVAPPLDVRWVACQVTHSLEPLLARVLVVQHCRCSHGKAARPKVVAASLAGRLVRRLATWMLGRVVAGLAPWHMGCWFAWLVDGLLGIVAVSVSC